MVYTSLLFLNSHDQFTIRVRGQLYTVRTSVYLASVLAAWGTSFKIYIQMQLLKRGSREEPLRIDFKNKLNDCIYNDQLQRPKKQETGMPRVYQEVPKGYRVVEMTFQGAMDVLSFPNMPVVQVGEDYLPLELIPPTIDANGCHCTQCLKKARSCDASSAEAGVPEGKS